MSFIMHMRTRPSGYLKGAATAVNLQQPLQLFLKRPRATLTLIIVWEFTAGNGYNFNLYDGKITAKTSTILARRIRRAAEK
jgi:hypothetical protein